ncbi:MAG: sigma 54-interacting transcriptional regulator [Ignavibacteria bacterium]|nr:sigma 54-interacting transcriptional regulator [Ignavibacteria bacterium]
MTTELSFIDIGKEKFIIPDGIAVIGRDCKIIVFNEAASRITGFSEDELINEDIKKILPDKQSADYITESLKSSRTFTNLPLDIKTKQEKTKNVLASITPIIKSPGNVTSVVFVFRDTNEMYELTEELREKTSELINQRNRLDAIFNSNIEGTYTIDEDWNITSFNTSAEKITGYSKEEAVGKKCWEIFKSNVCRNGCHMEQTMELGKSTIGNELEIINKNGEKIAIRVNSGILLDNENRKIGAVETFIDLSEIVNLTAHLTEKFRFQNIIGRNREMEKIYSILENVSQTDSTVLITGESGTGKELAARAIHLNSSRRAGPFVAINCSAFVESLIESELFGYEKGAFTGAVKTKIGKFEIAKGGTLFLDEIGDLSGAVQTKLLRVIETREYERVGGNDILKLDARIIVATNKNLNEEIKSGKFREDLFYRINVINIHLPPLRERLDDLPLLVNSFITKYNHIFNKSIKHFSTAAYDKLLHYDYRGNIRELENIVEHCFILCDSDIIEPEHLPERIRGFEKPVTDENNINSREVFREKEKEIIINLLRKNNGSRSKTADELGINPSTLWRKMKKLGID